MSFTYKDIDYGVGGLPVIKDDSIPYTEYDANTTINNLTYSYKTCVIFDHRMPKHISNVKFPRTYDTILYALKSKNEDGLYKYYQIMTPPSYFGFTTGFSNILGIIAQGISSQTVNITDETYIAIIENDDFLIFGYTVSVRGTIYLNGVGIQKTFLKFVLNEIDGVLESPEFGEASEPDGYEPDFDPVSEVIPIPEPPEIGVSNVGFVNVYKTDKNNLLNLGSQLFPDFTPPPPIEIDDSIPEMIGKGFESLVSNVSNLLNSYINSNLINYIIDCHCVPVTPPISGTEPIKIGFKEFPISGGKVTSDYVDFDCGTLSIKEYYGNFIDYIGTRAQLYLPFIGFVPIKNEFFQNGLLQVKYRFNVVDGSFMCFILSSSSKSDLSNSVVATYSGNACIHLPITGVNYSNMISGVVNGVGGVASGMASGNVGSAVNSAVNTMQLKPDMQQSNSYNATSAYLGIRYPYLMIEREVSNFSKKYHTEHGLPLNVTETIKNLTGFVQMDENIHVDIACMDEEKKMIVDALTSGIII